MVSQWRTVVRTSRSLVQMSDDGPVIRYKSLIMVLTQFCGFWSMPTIRIKSIGADCRVSTFQRAQRGLSSKLTEDHFVTIVIQDQSSLEFLHYSNWQWWWNILLHNRESDGAVTPSQADWHVADSGISLLHSACSPCSASILVHLSSCHFPISPSFECQCPTRLLQVLD